MVAPTFVLVEPPPPASAPAEPGEKKNKISTKISNMLKNRPKRTNNAIKPTKVETIEEYKTEVADVDDQIVVVRFYSPFCKTCKAAEKYFHKLCRDNPDIKFVELPTTRHNKYLHEGLGVPSFPYGHIYHPDAGLVEELKINKKVFGDFERVLQYYVGKFLQSDFDSFLQT